MVFRFYILQPVLFHQIIELDGTLTALCKLCCLRDLNRYHQEAFQGVLHVNNLQLARPYDGNLTRSLVI
jgi:hypothetical protein